MLIAMGSAPFAISFAKIPSYIEVYMPQSQLIFFFGQFEPGHIAFSVKQIAKVCFIFFSLIVP